MTSTSTTPNSGTGIDQPPKDVEKVRYIPNRTLRRLNKIAIKHGKKSLTDDCPILRDGFNAPIFLAHPGFDETGWIRCMIPATPDGETTVLLDIQFEEFNALPIHTSTGVTENDELEGERRS